MLICPQCQFENPNTNKFCQRCGTSLTHKFCQQCDVQVPVNAATCHNCGAFTGTVWLAIISKDSESLNSSVGTQAASIEPSQVAGNTSPAEIPQLPLPLTAEMGESPQPVTPKVLTQVPSISSPSAIEAGSPDAWVAPATVEPVIQSVTESVDAAVAQPMPSPLPSDSGESTSEEAAQGEETSPTPMVVYLDSQQRYRLIEPQSLQQLTADVQTAYGASVQVLDCQPFQKSLLEALIEQQDNLEKPESAISSNDEIAAPSVPSAIANANVSVTDSTQMAPQESMELPNSALNQISTLPSDTAKVLGIPAIAQPYITLHEAYYPTLPEVHDAWQQDGQAVVLLEDRSAWQSLGELWGSEQLSPLQILYWLDEMAQLWEALELCHCRQSLLEITNLRVDEDQALGLVRLYPEVQEQPLTLQDLGQMWQALFNQSQRTQFTSLSAVFRQMCTSEIKTIGELRSQLEAIAHEQQSSVSAASSYHESPVEAAATQVQAVAPDEASSALMAKSWANDANPSNDADSDPTVILPMQLLSLDDAGCTDIGRQRDHNEDSFGIQTQIKKQENPMGRAVQARGLYILCDGMGGHAAGEVASAMAVDTLKRYFQENWHEQFPSEDSVREAVRTANQAIYDVNQKNARSGSGRMGTTLVMMLIENTKAVIAHVGDSRLYRLTRKQGLEQITIDHEVGRRAIEQGVEPAIAYSRPDAYQLTQALGPRSDQFIKPDVQFLDLNEDTLFVLCSDGLSDNDLIETHWQTHLAPLLSSRANLDQGLLQLIEFANDHNGHDNITALLIRVKVRPNFEQQPLF